MPTLSGNGNKRALASNDRGFFMSEIFHFKRLAWHFFCRNEEY